MRLFIAIDMPEEANRELLKAQQQLKGASFSLPKSFHITLKFLGEAESERVESIKEALQGIKRESFAMSLSDAGAFPSIANSRVVWAGTKPEKEINELQKEADNVLFPLFEREGSFRSHITLARVKSIKDKKELKESIEGIKLSTKFKVTEFVLKESTLTREGPIYKNILKFALIDKT